MYCMGTSLVARRPVGRFTLSDTRAGAGSTLPPKFLATHRFRPERNAASPTADTRFRSERTPFRPEQNALAEDLTETPAAGASGVADEPDGQADEADRDERVAAPAERHVHEAPARLGQDRRSAPRGSSRGW
jgi:hypothetical protein